MPVHNLLIKRLRGVLPAIIVYKAQIIDNLKGNVVIIRP